MFGVKLAPDTYPYDANGNMTCRIENPSTGSGQAVTYSQTYNAENRISSIAKRTGDCTTGTIVESWSFAYDGDGVRVSTAHFTGTSGSPDSTTSYFMGGQFEVKDGATKKYYSIAGMMVAMNDGTGLQYLLTDHLGSTLAVTNQSGTLTSQQRYLPFGAARTIPNSPILGTDFTYTGQRKLDDGMGGVMDYKARFYSPMLGRFLQPDSIIPNQTNPQSWNRFSYVVNNPIAFNDPTGHLCEPGDCISAGDSKDKDDLGVTLKGWSDENKAAMQRELRAIANRLKNAYEKFRFGCHRAIDDICADMPAMSASQIFRRVFGKLTWTRDTSGYGGCDASNNTCGSETNDYATDPDDVGLLTHEFGHLFDHRITGSFGYGRNVLGKSTILDANGKYVEGIPIGGGTWTRTDEGYASKRRPDMQHPLTMGGACSGTSACEDFADMFMNWVQNSFADNDAGRARYDWMDAQMGSWVYSSMNR